MPDTPEPESEQPEPEETPLPPAEPIVINAENSIFPIQAPEEFALLPTALGYFDDGRMECGMLMLRSACRLDRASYQLPCRRFAYALDDPLEHCTYDYGMLQELYSPNGSEAEPFSCKVLAFCACLRMLFSEDLRGLAGYEYLIREPNLSSLFEDTLYELAPELRSVIYDLCTIFETFHRGFDASLIGMTQKAADSGEQLQEIQDTARSLLDARLERTTTSNGRLLSLRAKLFGPSGELMSLLKAVLDNDTTRLDEVKRFCARFLRPGTSHPNSDRFDPRALKHYVDTTYETVEGYNHDAIIGGGFSSIITNLNKILNILTRWIDLNRDGQITDEASLELIRRIGTRLSEHLSSAEQTLQALQPDELLDRAAVSCLRQTLQEMNLRIQGKFRVPEEFYLDFLSGDQIELNPETGLPELEESVSIIPGYELWRRVYNHANNPRPLSSIPEQIYPADGSCTFDFGRAVLYQRYLEAHQLPQAVSADRIAQDRPSAQKMLSVWIKSFESRLELIDSYGRLEIGRKDRILLEIEQSYLPHAQKTGNFGFFRRATQAYLHAADLASLKLRDEVSLELRQLEETQGALPITQTIRALIEAGKYSVASDYIRLAVNEGYQQAPADGMLLESASRDHLADFIDSYNRLFDQYFAPNTLFERIYSEQYPPAQDHNRQLRSARLFVNSWPKGNTALGDTAELLTQLGFSPASVKEVGPLAREVTIQPSSMRLSEYAHPIAAFGTRLSKTGLQVNYLLGRFNCASLMDHLRSFGRNERPLLVILDYALTLPERRELARAFKHEGANLRTMLLIDRVLAAYLTQFNISERALALLQCTLPFHYCNPYFENPQSIIPPEMFMGRRQELNAILENGRCNIIYGGRQLGKTALLHRARYLADDHENGSWSLYVDLKPDDKDSAAAHICRELKRADFGFLPEQTECTDWQSLSDAIRARMNDPARPVSRLLLLLDEADRFLDSSASDSYRAVEILSALQTQTEDRFKFVLAGLHNVQRFQARATEHNSKLAHLHSMAIKPLSYADASQLLELPLFYLGFRMKPNQTALISQVLSSCNYYPGLIHFYCSRLISRLSERSGGTRSVHSEPPYYLDDDQIRMLIQDKTFNEQIHEKFFITLQVDEQDYYKILSYALAYCYMDNQKNAALGFTAGDVLEICEAFNITSVTNLPRSSVEALMRELEELNILRSISDGRYSFNRR
ncbi:MAG: AAA family ATPase, partial [Butyricicoccaceae bacterium]